MPNGAPTNARPGVNLQGPSVYSGLAAKPMRTSVHLAFDVSTSSKAIRLVPRPVPPLLRDAHGSSLGFSSPPAGASAATGLPPGLRAGTAMLVMTRPRRSG